MKITINIQPNQKHVIVCPDCYEVIEQHKAPKVKGCIKCRLSVKCSRCGFEKMVAEVVK